ncbi:terminase small subunit [Ancylobacter sp. Lp-2]|uniref:terminase small subunit n=1 Tax=Ancylobacter sp. Lp-2 TaxID=2881339 RepID=UPI001E41FDA2|nr:terminase small subunit [Ancylobacter sp. Lp-2]MCB4769646.1 terminase small subunit [Ancylobacter sp. Lp-2]
MIDANDLVQHRRCACHYCWGKGHNYMWCDEVEFAEELAKAEGLPESLQPKDVGGYGFNPFMPPHSSCPRCYGVGESTIYVPDSKLHGPIARLLYRGTKKTKDGLEILMADQDKAMEMVARHLGMFNDKLKVQGDTENPLTVLIRELQGSSLQPVANPPD